MKLDMTLEEMIAKLDGACGRLIVASMNNKEVYDAKEMIKEVSLALGDVEEIKFYDYKD